MVVGGAAEVSERDTLRLIKWQLAEKTGWTLEYIDSMALDDLMYYMGIQEASVKYQEYERERSRHRRKR